VVEAGTNDLKAKFDLKIEDLELSVNAIHHLKQANLYYLGELVRESESMLIAKGLTRKNIREIQLLLQEDGMTLEMDTGGWGPII
jgi:DNA-directed RNA polymerase alpha subunit